MKAYLLAGVIACAAAGLAPALAQNAAAPAPMQSHHMTMQPMTRAQVVQKVQQHFAMLDTNRDGFITKEEAQAVHKAKRGDRLAMRGEKMFDRLDSNNDGSVSKQEFDAAHQARMERRGTRAPGAMHRRGGMMGHMFEMADANKDGRVSLQEATAAAAAHFDRADANRDGMLTPDEMRSAHQAMRGKAGR